MKQFINIFLFQIFILTDVNATLVRRFPCPHEKSKLTSEVIKNKWKWIKTCERENIIKFILRYHNPNTYPVYGRIVENDMPTYSVDDFIITAEEVNDCSIKEDREILFVCSIE
ncbi:MAG: hypothetical protein ACPGJV_12020 [Bacteriovoracaceae bacterium]